MGEILDTMAKADAVMDVLSKELHGVAHNLKGQAGTFGFTLLSQLAGKLCEYIRTRAAGLQAGNLPVLRAYHAALKFVLSKRLEGDGGEAGRAILAKIASLSGPPES
jgi:hypothetical protein